MCGHMCEYELVFVKLLQAQKGVVKYKRSREVIEQFVLMHDYHISLIRCRSYYLVHCVFWCSCYLSVAAI